MNTATYLVQHKQEIKNPQLNTPYRVVGYHVGGAIYKIERIEEDIVYFEGYNLGRKKDSLRFFEVN